MPFIPDVDQKELLLAQNYLIRKNHGLATDELLDKQGKDAYNNIYNKISSKIPVSNIFSSFIGEKGYQISEELVEKYLSNVDEAKKYDKEQLYSIITELHDKLKISEMKSINYEEEYAKSNVKIEPEASQENTKRNNRYNIYKS
jgi:hypothetical protein